MKLTKETLREIIEEVINENDGHPQIIKKNKEVAHNWATHMEWRSATDKERYGDMIGEVIHHTLFEDGTITKYDVKFGNRTIKNIPTEMLEVVETQEHMHAATDDKEEDEEKEETFANYGPKGDAGPNKAVKAKKVKQTIKKIT